MPAAVSSAPCSSSFGSFLSHSEREARVSDLSRSVRVICQYQPDSGSSNSGSPSDWDWRAGRPARGGAFPVRGGGVRVGRGGEGGPRGAGVSRGTAETGDAKG